MGSRPIGLTPPSGLGNSTVMTRALQLPHCPVRSHAWNMLMRAVMASSDRRSRARGDTLSTPTPVPMGKLLAAILMSVMVRGSRLEQSCSAWCLTSSSRNGSMYSFCVCHQEAHSSVSLSTVTWSAAGAMEPLFFSALRVLRKLSLVVQSSSNVPASSGSSWNGDSFCTSIPSLLPAHPHKPFTHL